MARVASVRQKPGQLAGLERHQLACRAGTWRRLVEDEYLSSEALGDELRDDRGDEAAADDQVGEGARAQRPSSWFTDSFLSMMAVAGSWTSSPAMEMCGR